MANRAERRRMMRESVRGQALYANYTRQQRIDALMQQGISPDDLRREREEGLQIGYTQGSLSTIKACYAAIAIALHDEFEFDNDSIYRALKAVDTKTIYCLENTELVNELFEKTGIELDLDDTFDRVKQNESTV